MDEAQREHRVVADDGRHVGVRLGEQIVETYGLGITDKDVQDLVADVTREILERARTLFREGLPSELAILWGHECVNGVQDRILEHMSYLHLAAALVGVDPARAILPHAAGYSAEAMNVARSLPAAFLRDRPWRSRALPLNDMGSVKAGHTY